MTEARQSCVEPAKGPMVEEQTQRTAFHVASAKEGVTAMTAGVGQKAPDFEAAAYVQGGFQNIKLSDFLGKWVVLCFYPGDFTFV